MVVTFGQGLIVVAFFTVHCLQPFEKTVCTRTIDLVDVTVFGLRVVRIVDVDVGVVVLVASTLLHTVVVAGSGVTVSSSVTVSTSVETSVVVVTAVTSFVEVV